MGRFAEMAAKKDMVLKCELFENYRVWSGAQAMNASAPSSFLAQNLLQRRQNHCFTATLR